MDKLYRSVSAISFFVASDQKLKNMIVDFAVDDANRVHIQYNIRNYLETLWFTSPEISGAVLYLPEADGVCTTANGISSLLYAEKNGWIEDLGNQRGKILQCRETIQRGNSVFNILSLIRIDGKEGIPLGYLSFELSQQALYDQCLAPGLSTANSIIFAVDFDTQIISYNGNEEIGQKFLQIEKDLKKIAFLNIEMIPVAGVEYIVSRSHPTNLDWQVIELTPISDVVNMRQYTILNLIICLILFSGLVLTTVWISRAFTKPIEQLGTIMNSSDPLSSELVEEYLSLPTEVGQLYRSYTDMTGNISQLMKKQKELMEEERLNQLRTLRAQINPHFMYNSLDYLNWKAQDSNTPEIARMLTLLSRFLRISLSSNEFKCLLKSEIAHVSAYLEIFRTRYNGMFSYRIDCNEELYNCIIPQFILQPLVENAIIHGFERKFTDAEIVITIAQHDGFLEFAVRDNGKGVDPDTFDQALQGKLSENENHGFGLRNTSQRISFICSENEFSGFHLIPSERGAVISFSLKCIREDVCGKS
jgi:two-component system sensor histidine kinase YesM